MNLWDAVSLLSARRLLTPDDAELPLLRELARQGYASQCGQLFHVTPQCDRVAACVREAPQPELFA